MMKINPVIKLLSNFFISDLESRSKYLVTTTFVYTGKPICIFMSNNVLGLSQQMYHVKS